MDIGTIELVPYFPILGITSHGFQHINTIKEIVIPVNFVKYMIGTLVVIVVLAIHVMNTVNDVVTLVIHIFAADDRLSVFFTTGPFQTSDEKEMLARMAEDE